MSALQKLIRVAGVAACLIMVASFAAFANDKNKAASDQQVTVLDGNDPDKAAEQVRQQQAVAKHSDIRIKIDKANDFLAKPFDWITESSGSQWVKHGVTLVGGLALYGLLFFWFARTIPGSRPEEPSVWQA